MNLNDENDEPIKVRGIERTVESIVDIPTTWQIYYTLDGHMANRVQIGYPAVMKILKTPKSIEIDEYLERPIIGKRDLDWEKDLQMKSMFLDRKEELKNEYDKYLHDTPELKSLIADYMQSILTFKPSDTVTFSAKFFAPYSAKTAQNKLLPQMRQQINLPKH
jgi:hypothetical protein